MDENHASELMIVIAFLATAVVFVPLFKRFGLGAVLGYLAAGVLLGPSMLDITKRPEAILEFAELGVVFLLFLIGLELNPNRLWSMRRDIFGLGLLQIIVCSGLLMIYPLLVAGRPWEVALVAGLGLALSSTALVIQIIEERGAMGLQYGQKTFAVLLMQDIAIVPLLLIVTFLAPGGGDEPLDGAAMLVSVGKAVLAVGGVILVGHYLLSPVFRILARFGGREIMTAAALLVVLSAGTALVSVGLSMAMGAFLAGVLLAESNYRRELEADIEPFRGLLLGLFFLSVGMTIELPLVADNLLLVAGGVITLVVLKGLIVYGLARGFGENHMTATKTGLLLSQGGEFGFVLFSAAASQGVMTTEDSSLLIATVILSMVTTPLLLKFLTPILIRPNIKAEPAEDFDGADGEILVIGFGRFGQLVSQMLLAGGHTPTLLDNDAERVTEAQRFGNRVYYGDGRRLDVLRAAGAEHARIIMVCVAPAACATTVVDLVKAHFTQALVFARAYDRRHALTLFDHKVDYQRRETFDSALRFGRDALVALGAEADAAKEAEVLVRKRDRDRLEYQRIEGLAEGHAKWREVTPEPYTNFDDVGENDRKEAAAE
ncbi:monovalent cation:proton antiporter-2 (CPA2) family protein [Acuticoccus sp. MNP-M23]|uniref:monovalent cation:proton antiporter-2 (CPA2) family protein n=1 Tax=Acuticoccus sp. MNP-M23 TaxID=3072793 RepID=UPI0028153A3F|nr:monovalent cation:proton antiporter-2 (CPA2) family protein [Acuticoccus sp. MNP-M23]WMS44378.1 monovalent cation:proton antiporter-2 (CPA2) family protein [Acuticoccus sp. MNP-M23]